jgi:hypothetical protein
VIALEPPVETGKVGCEDEGNDLPAGEGDSKASGEGVFACGSILCDVAQVVDSDQNGGEAPDLKAGDESVPIPLTGLDEGRAEHGDEAKEEDNKEFAETSIGEGVRSSGVSVAEVKGGKADEKDGPASSFDEGDSQQSGAG